MKNYTTNFKRYMLITAMFVISNIASAQLCGEFVIFNDGHCNFTAKNTYNTSGVIKGDECEEKQKHRNEHCEIGHNSYNFADDRRKNEKKS